MSAVPPSSPPPGGDDLIHPHQPPRNPIAVLLLNFAGGCLGYFMIGQKTKGIVALVAWIVGLFPPLCSSLSWLVSLVAAIDGYLQAQHLAAGRPVRAWSFFNDHA